MVHRGTAVEHEHELGFKRNDAGERAERIVFAQGMTREVRAFDESPRFTQARGLGERDGGERHLRELREVEQAVRVMVVHAVGGDVGGVVAHDGEDRESQLATGHGVGPLPHFARGGALGALVEHHALVLDALAGVDECADGRAGDGGAA